MISSNPKSRSSFMISAYDYRIKYKRKTYPLKYLYFASIFKFLQRYRNIIRREDYLRYHTQVPVVQTNTIKWYLNIFAFLKWNRRYFYVITKTLNEEIKNSDYDWDSHFFTDKNLYGTRKERRLILKSVRFIFQFNDVREEMNDFIRRYKSYIHLWN